MDYLAEESCSPSNSVPADSLACPDTLEKNGMLSNGASKSINSGSGSGSCSSDGRLNSDRSCNRRRSSILLDLSKSEMHSETDELVEGVQERQHMSSHRDSEQYTQSDEDACTRVSPLSNCSRDGFSKRCLRRASRSVERNSSHRSRGKRRSITHSRSSSRESVVASRRNVNRSSERGFASKEERGTSSRRHSSRGSSETGSLRVKSFHRNSTGSRLGRSSSRSLGKSRSRETTRRRRRPPSNGSDDARRPSSRTASPHNVPSDTTEDKGTKRKRRTGWDSGPLTIPGGAAGLLPGLNTPYVPGAVGFTAPLSDKLADEIQAELAERQAQAASVAATMQLRATASQLCRIYVGSLDYSLTENEVRQVFSAFGPITNIDMPKEGTRSKGFCFVEYATPESANMAIATMPGFNLKGRAIKVGRPTALGGQSVAVSPMFPGIKPAAGVNAAEAGQLAAAMLLAKAEGGGSSLAQTPSQNRVYVGSVPYNFTNNDIKEIFDVFGTIISCQLIPSNERPGTHRGYGFIEYSKFEEAKLAIETMNDFPVAGKILKVNYATAMRGGFGSTMGPSPSQPFFSDVSGATGANGIPVMNQSVFPDLSKPQNFTIPPLAPTLPSMVCQAPPAPPLSTESAAASGAPDASSLPVDPTATTFCPAVLLLSNMAESHEVNEDLKEEVRQECSKYGTVTTVEIAVDPSAPSAVRIFVVFDKPDAVAAATPALHDRWFGGRKIVARQYDLSLYRSRQLWA